MILLVTSCTNEIDQLTDYRINPDNTANKSNSRSSEYSILTFDDFESYQTALINIEKLETEEEKEDWVEKTYPSFKSIHDIYMDAMNEMAETDESFGESEYNAFKIKYENLYFPEIDEDLGFYIPLKNSDVSYLANSDCKVVIGIDTIALRDIYNYQELIELGRAYYSNDIPMPLADMISFNINNYDQNSVGPEYDSGWKQYGNRKVKLKARRVFKKGNLAPGVGNSTAYICNTLMHLEFCFRKKRWVGWINYSCKTEINFSATVPPIGYTGSKSGTSSHDWEFPYPIQITQNTQNWYYTFPPTDCKALVDYADLADVLEFNWTMAGLQSAWSKTNATARPQFYPYYE